jgi:hypothetical protein
MTSRAVFRPGPAALGALALLLLPQAATAWGTATHVLIAKRLGHQFGNANIQEMYGATLPDFPMLMFGSPYQEFLYQKTHYAFMQLVQQAPLGYPKATAYGFAGHNEAWGADYSAHIQALTLSGAGGYIVRKIPPLAAVLLPGVSALLASRGINDPQLEARLSATLADTALEAAVDLRISRKEFPEVGLEMMLASALRGAYVPSLVVSAFAKDLAVKASISEAQAAAILVAAEAQNRQYVATYGAALSQANRTDLVAGLIAQLAVQAVPGLGSPEAADLLGLIHSSLASADEFVRYDYAREIEATLERTSKELLKHWIFTWLIP